MTSPLLIAFNRLACRRWRAQQSVRAVKLSYNVKHSQASQCDTDSAAGGWLIWDVTSGLAERSWRRLGDDHTHTQLRAMQTLPLCRINSQTHTAHLAGRARTHTHTLSHGVALQWEIYTDAGLPTSVCIQGKVSVACFRCLNINNLCDCDVEQLLKLCSSDP